MQISISKTSFTSTYASIMFRNLSFRLSHQRIRIFELSHQNSRTKSWKNQQSFVRLLRRFSLQHLHRYLNQYYQNVRIFLLRHSISHRNRWRNYQSIHLHLRFHLFEHLYENIKNFTFRNFISSSMIWFANFMKNLNHLIYIRIENVLFFRNVSILVHLINHVLFISHESFSTSCLQSIRKHQLVKSRKTRIRRIFNNIRLRNRFVLLLFCQKNRSFRYTKN